MNEPASAVRTTTLFVSDADVAALTNWSAAVEALRNAYARPFTPDMVPTRAMARGEGFWLRSMLAISPSGEYMGCKLIAASPRTRRASYLISLYDQRSMDLVALIDGSRITGIRTAATSAVAVDLLAPRLALRVAVIGTGFEARSHLEAVLAIRKVASARAYSPNPASRERFVAAFASRTDLDLQQADSAREAVRGTNLVLVAARSRDERPVLLGDWLEPGMTVVSIGSTLPEQREVDEATMARATRIVADMPEEVIQDTGDALAATSRGVDLAGKTISLADVVTGRRCGREAEGDILLYKSVGGALQDVVIAEMFYRLGRASGRLRAMPYTIETINK